VLFLGRPGVGKTTAIREIARTLSDSLHKRVVIVDTSNEIGGDSDVPHSAIGGARRMQVADASRQHDVMIEAVENHMPEVLIVDEIGTEAEALACRTIAERGVVLIGTAHGCFLENLIKNPTLSGGWACVTGCAGAARAQGGAPVRLLTRRPLPRACCLHNAPTGARHTPLNTLARRPGGWRGVGDAGRRGGAQPRHAEERAGAPRAAHLPHRGGDAGPRGVGGARHGRERGHAARQQDPQSAGVLCAAGAGWLLWLRRVCGSMRHTW
jgi:hypothetical protein